MAPRYLHNWSCKEDLVRDFGGHNNSGIDPWPQAQVILASYGCASYKGTAFVLFCQGGTLYEANGSHCSCHGLEGQWSPEETSLASLKHRLEKGRLGSDSYTENIFSQELAEVLAELEAETVQA